MSVVLPESICAEMPMLRIFRSSGNVSSCSAGSALNDLQYHIYLTVAACNSKKKLLRLLQRCSNV